MNDQFLILLVEDNPADVRLTQEALKNGKVRHELQVVADGVQAMAYLRRENPYSRSTRPDLILLDLNLPRKDGREVLAEVKADPGLTAIPVIILTSSQAEEDILKSYNQNANGYIVKPVDVNQFFEVIKQLEDFWLKIVMLPPKGKK